MVILLELSRAQRNILLTLVYLYKLKRRKIKSEEISEYLNMNMATVRNMMQNLKILGFVKSITGPRGGYIPTDKAYKALAITPPDKAINVPVYVNSKRADLLVEEIEFASIGRESTAKIKAFGADKVNIGDEMIIGPTPVNLLVIQGKVVGKDDFHIVIELAKAWAFPKEKVEECLRPVITADPDESIVDAVKTMVKNNVSCLLVCGEDMGFITTEGVGRAVAKNDINNKVKNYVEDGLVVVKKGTTLYEAFMQMHKNHAKVAVVVDDKPIGLVTDHMILEKMILDKEECCQEITN